MRKNLKEARKKAGMTQQQMADRLEIGLRHYKKIESGETLGSIPLWDTMEDILKTNQRVLREIHLDKEDNQ
ncbi:MAG: helix-turn-helix transcriptional regulator [Lachnospiraceae bacterium]